MRWVGLFALCAQSCYATSAGQVGLVGMAAKDDEEAFAETLRPADISPTRTSTRATRKLRVRVRAEERFQREVVGWQVRVYRQISRANELLVRDLGVELELVEIKPWAAKVDLTDLYPSFEELRTFDSAEDVDLVIGFMTPLPVTASLDQLGIASLLGRHIVLRGMDDADEYEALERALGRISNEEREKLYSARLRHKEVASLLHELGHHFGAPHERDSASIMNATYDNSMSSFSTYAVELMQLGIEARGRGGSAAAATSRMAALLRSTEWDGWIDEDRQRLLALLQGDSRERSNSTDREYSRPADDGKARPESDPFAESREAARSGQFEFAWERLQPILDARKDDGAVQRLACEISAARGPDSDASLTQCLRAVALAKDDPLPELILGRLLLRRGRVKEATKSLESAEAKILKAPESDWPWLTLGQIYRSASAVSLAERANSHVKDPKEANQVAAWAGQMRRSHASAFAAGLEQTDEIEYFGALERAGKAIREGAVDEALSANEALRKRFPKLPGAEVALCEALQAAGDLSRAKRWCQEAVKRDPRNGRGFLYLGFVLLASGAAAKSVPLLERAIELSPDEQQAWTLLDFTYRSVGRKDKASQLGLRFQERFGKSLPSR